jgi:hypothetical protein
MFAFAVEGAADRGERLGERKNVARDEQVRILSADRMPVNSIGCNRDFRDQVGSANCDTLSGGATQSDAAYYPVFRRNFLFI